jgi:hypothetical protein
MNIFLDRPERDGAVSIIDPEGEDKITNPTLPFADNKPNIFMKLAIFCSINSSRRLRN